MKLLPDSNDGGVRVIYEDIVYGMDEAGNDMFADLHVILNDDGLICDLIDGDDIVGTAALDRGQLAEWCIDGEW